MAFIDNVNNNGNVNDRKGFAQVVNSNTNFMIKVGTQGFILTVRYQVDRLEGQRSSIG